MKTMDSITNALNDLEILKEELKNRSYKTKIYRKSLKITIGSEIVIEALVRKNERHAPERFGMNISSAILSHKTDWLWEQVLYADSKAIIKRLEKTKIFGQIMTVRENLKNLGLVD